MMLRADEGVGKGYELYSSVLPLSAAIAAPKKISTSMTTDHATLFRNLILAVSAFPPNMNRIVITPLGKLYLPQGNIYLFKLSLWRGQGKLFRPELRAFSSLKGIFLSWYRMAFRSG